jgi:hypothetical protein
MVRMLIAAVFLVVALTQSAQAQFVSKYETWRGLSESSQVGYVMAILDSFILTSDTPDQQVFGDGIELCAVAIKLSGDMLRDAVEQAYLRMPNRWGEPPLLIVRGVVHHMCLKHVNIEREKVGLKPWLPWKDW